MFVCYSVFVVVFFKDSSHEIIPDARNKKTRCPQHDTVAVVTIRKLRMKKFAANTRPLYIFSGFS